MFDSIRSVTKIIIEHVPLKVLANTAGDLANLLESGGAFAEFITDSFSGLNQVIHDVGLDAAVEGAAEAVAENLPVLGIVLGSIAIGRGAVRVANGTTNTVGNYQLEYGSRARASVGVAQVGAGGASFASQIIGPGALPASLLFSWQKRRAEKRAQEAEADLDLQRNGHQYQFKKVQDIDTLKKYSEEKLLVNEEEPIESALGLIGQVPYPRVHFQHPGKLHQVFMRDVTVIPDVVI